MLSLSGITGIQLGVISFVQIITAYVRLADNFVVNFKYGDQPERIFL